MRDSDPRDPSYKEGAEPLCQPSLNGGSEGSRTLYLSACKADAFATLEPRTHCFDDDNYTIMKVELAEILAIS